MTSKITQKLTAHEIRTAEKYLASQDRTMGSLIKDLGPCDLAKRSDTPFASLSRIIISQQLSARAASTIQGRILLVTKTKALTPENWLSASTEDLRSAGLSRPKIEYISELAKCLISEELDFNTIGQMDAPSLVDTLTKLSGVGTWTAQMYLIFSEKHPNILALDDAALRRAARALYNCDNLQDLESVWSPYCSVASWYLWRYLDK